MTDAEWVVFQAMRQGRSYRVADLAAQTGLRKSDVRRCLNRMRGDRVDAGVPAGGGVSRCS